MLTGIITHDNMVVLSDDGYPIIESDKPSVPEYCKAVSRYTETNGKIIQSWEDLKSKIDDQAQEINQLNLAASQCQQNAYLISQLRPNPVPAFQVANPFASMYTGCCNTNVSI